MKKLLLVLIYALIGSHVNAQGIINTVVGIGTPGYSGDAGSAISAELWSPQGIYVDSIGNFFIADYQNNVVRKVDAATNIISTVAGNGTSGYIGDGSSATNAELHGPTSVFLDVAGNIYVTDAFNNVVRKVTTSTGIITTIAGTGISGYSGDGGQATNAKLNVPSGICIDHFGDIVIADFGNHAIRKINHSTGEITTIAGNGSPGYSGDNILATTAKLYNPSGVFVDSNEDIFIADTYNNRIRKVTASSGIITTIIGTGVSGYSGDDNPATAAEISFPVGIFVDGSSNIFISEVTNNIIRKVIGTTHIINTIAGDGTSGFLGDGGISTSAEFAGPYGIYVQKSGNIFIADEFNNRIREITTSPNRIPNIGYDNKIQIFPNPANKILNVTNLEENTMFYINNILGECVLNGVFTAQNNLIHIGNLPQGIYVIQLINDHGERKIIKVIKE